MRVNVASANRNSHYLHGTAPEEQDRLARMNELLNESALRELALSGEEKIIDVGCGLGQLARAMARQLGSRGAVIGVERSADQLAEARRLAERAGEDRLVEFRQGEASCLPLQDG